MLDKGEAVAITEPNSIGVKEMKPEKESKDKLKKKVKKLEKKVSDLNAALEGTLSMVETLEHRLECLEANQRRG